MNFYKKLYYKLATNGATSEPCQEMMIIAYIASCQTFNLVTIINLFFLIARPGEIYHFPSWFVIIYLSTYAVNYYYFETRKNGQKLLDKKSYSSKGYMSIIYLVISLILVCTSFSYISPKVWKFQTYSSDTRFENHASRTE